MPRSESAAMFYKRQISLYNFTIYDLAMQEGSCFLWDETIAKRRANEFVSCVWYHINEQIKMFKISITKNDNFLDILLKGTREISSAN